MENFRLELQRIWDWEKLTPEEYKEDSPPSNPKLIRNISGKKMIASEWETDYPDFDSLEIALISYIQRKTIKEDENLDLFLQAISIDNESERFCDLVVKYVSSEIFELLLSKALADKFIDAQWQLISRIPEININNKVDYVKAYIKSGGTEYVKSRARYVFDNNLFT
jgi:hypothetical protein